VTAAVLFDLDGVLLDSEPTWDEARRRYVADHGGTWRPEATERTMGMSAPEWARYLHDELGVAEPPEAISDGVVALVLAAYRDRLPLMPHATETVPALARRWPLGLASSSNRPVIEAVLDASGLRPCFAAVVSSEEVPRGKPAPDVYLAVAAALDVEARDCVAVEDSANGIRSAHAAAAHTIAVPNPRFPPEPEVLTLAVAILGSLAELTPDLVAGLGPT
jgi:HAD superfamily hydrolase (TIGR01509 family)